MSRERLPMHGAWEELHQEMNEALQRRGIDLQKGSRDPCRPDLLHLAWMPPEGGAAWKLQEILEGENARGRAKLAEHARSTRGRGTTPDGIHIANLNLQCSVASAGTLLAKLMEAGGHSREDGLVALAWLLHSGAWKTWGGYRYEDGKTIHLTDQVIHSGRGQTSPLLAPARWRRSDPANLTWESLGMPDDGLIRWEQRLSGGLAQEAERSLAARSLRGTHGEGLILKGGNGLLPVEKIERRSSGIYASGQAKCLILPAQKVEWSLHGAVPTWKASLQIERITWKRVISSGMPVLLKARARAHVSPTPQRRILAPRSHATDQSVGYGEYKPNNEILSTTDPHSPDDSSHQLPRGSIVDKEPSQQLHSSRLLLCGRFENRLHLTDELGGRTVMIEARGWL